MKASSEEEQYSSSIGQIARGAGISSFGQGAGRLVWYATQVMLARMFGPTQLGIYVLGSTLVNIARIFAVFGMDNGLVRYVAHYQAERDIPRIRGTILLALGIGLGLSLALSALTFFSANFLAELFAERPSDITSLETIFEAFSLSIPFFAVMNVALWATQGFQTLKYATYVQEFALPIINLALVVLFYFLGAQLLGAVAAYVISLAASLILALYYLQRIFPELLDQNIPPKWESWALLSASGPMVIASYSAYINNWSVVAILGIFANTTTVGIFNAASRTASVSLLLLYAFSSIFAPMVSSLYRRGLLEELYYLYKQVSHWILTGTLAGFLLTVVLAKDFMAIFGEEFISGWPVLVVVAGAELVNSSVGPADRMLSMTGHHKVVLLATIAGAVAAVVVSVALIPIYGIMGGAVATAGGIVLTRAIIVIEVRNVLSFWPYSRQNLKPVFAGLLTAAAAFLVRPVLPIPADGVWAIIILGPALLITFVMIVLALGLSRSDRQLLRAFWTAVCTFLRRTG